MAKPKKKLNQIKDRKFPEKQNLVVKTKTYI